MKLRPVPKHFNNEIILFPNLDWCFVYRSGMQFRSRFIAFLEYMVQNFPQVCPVNSQLRIQFPIYNLVFPAGVIVDFVKKACSILQTSGFEVNYENQKLTEDG